MALRNAASVANTIKAAPLYYFAGGCILGVVPRDGYDHEWTLDGGMGPACSDRTVFAVRTTVRFDVNEWPRDRQARQETKVRAMCPHVTVYKDDAGQVVFQGAFVLHQAKMPGNASIAGM